MGTRLPFKPPTQQEVGHCAPSPLFVIAESQILAKMKPSVADHSPSLCDPLSRPPISPALRAADCSRVCGLIPSDPPAAAGDQTLDPP